MRNRVKIDWHALSRRVSSATFWQENCGLSGTRRRLANHWRNRVACARTCICCWVSRRAAKSTCILCRHHGDTQVCIHLTPYFKLVARIIRRYATSDDKATCENRISFNPYCVLHLDKLPCFNLNFNLQNKQTNKQNNKFLQTKFFVFNSHLIYL